MKKKVFALLIVTALVLSAFAACQAPTPSNSTAPSTEISTASSVAPTTAAKPYIPVICKGFQHQFWQTVKAGAEKAGADLGADVFFTGPEGESAQAAQVDMLSAELAKDPSAICLAALNTEAVLSQLKDAADRKIPVIGFDSGVPNAPAGQIAATAATDNKAAAAMAADHMYDALKDKITAATASNPVVISVISQDVTSASITLRAQGFTAEMKKVVEAGGSTAAITGDYADVNSGDAAASAVIIKVTVSASADTVDMTNTASGVLNMDNLIGVFCSNEGAVKGFLAAVQAGSVIPAGVVVVGFDAGAGQKDAVRKGVFLGSITQDPYQIGYKAVELAVKAINGEAVSDVDTGAKWYDASNMDEPDIAQLLYD
jgi:ribose transport system substrate-binding protein